MTNLKLFLYRIVAAYSRVFALAQFNIMITDMYANTVSA